MNTASGTRNGRRLYVIAAFGAAVAAFFLFAVTPSEVWAGQQFVRVLGSAQTVSVKSEANGGPVAPAVHKDANGNPMANLKAARNEFESFQVYVKADAGGIANLRVDPGTPLRQIDPATGNAIAGGASIPTENLTFYREHFINIGDQAGEYASDIPEGGQGEWADALIPETDFIYNEDRKAFPFKLNSGERAVAWVDVLVPARQAPGVYEGTVLVKDDAGARAVLPGEPARGTTMSTIPVRIEVKNFGIPSESTLDSAFMQNHQYHNPCYGYAASMCDTADERWKLFSQYARVGLENRVSMPSPWGMGSLGDAPPTVLDSPFKTYALPLIEGMDSSREYGDPAQSRLDGAKLTSVGAYYQCAQDSNTCLPAWKTLAERHGFKDRFFLYACDEPNTSQALWDQCMANAQEAKTLDPSIRTLVTGTPQRAQTYANPEKIDISVPLLNHVDAYNCCGNPYIGNQRDDAAYTSFLEADHTGTGSNELWSYTSNMSHGSDDNSNSRLWDGWPGYVIDQPDTQARAMGWMSFYYGLSGELYYQNTDAQLNAWNNQYNLGGNGDGNLFYPGVALGDGTRAPAIGGTHDIPIESIRLKKIRDGREDYEYMHKLKAQGKEAQAKNIIGSAYPNGYGDQNYQTACPTTDRPTSPDGGCGASAMYTTISAEKMEAARLALMNLVSDEPLDDMPPLGTCQGEANTIVGSDDPAAPDNLLGEDGQDVIDARRGDDALGTLNNGDLACGGDGHDTFKRFAGMVQVDGGGETGDDNADVLDFSWVTQANATGQGVHVSLSGISSGAGFEVMATRVGDAIGSSLPDTMRGDDMRNTIEGGSGGDDISGGAEAAGAQGDRIYGEAGNDTIAVLDGSIDTINCGSGTDKVEADATDVIVDDPNTAGKDCEQVDRPDTADPVVTPVSPKPGASIRDRTPTIRAAVRDNVTDLVKGDVKLYVRGTIIPGANYSYDPGTDALVYGSTRLPAGRKTTVRVVATDAADNEGARAWSFTIRRR